MEEKKHHKGGDLTQRKEFFATLKDFSFLLEIKSSTKGNVLCCAKRNIHCSIMPSLRMEIAQI